MQQHKIEEGDNDDDLSSAVVADELFIQDKTLGLRSGSGWGLRCKHLMTAQPCCEGGLSLIVDSHLHIVFELPVRKRYVNTISENIRNARPSQD